MSIGFSVTCTGKYTRFVRQLIESINRNFIADIPKVFFFFTDRPEELPDGENIVKTIIPFKGFPGDTLYKFHHLLLQKGNIIKMVKYIYIIDADMRISSVVGKEILPDDKTPYVGIRHPGYPDIGTVETNMKSKAYIDPKTLSSVRTYWCGGVTGGLSLPYISMAEQIVKAIDEDDFNEIVAIWHDESHINRFFHYTRDLVKTLPPDYCYPEGLGETEIKRRWGRQLENKITALLKKHEEVRTLEKGKLSVVLKGGLGNQLFEVATAIAYAKKYDLQLILDMFTSKGDRRQHSFRSSFLRNFSRIENISKIKFTLYSEPKFTYNEIPQIKCPALCLDGFFQSQKYFHDYNELIAKMFSPPPKFKDAINIAIKKINPTEETVSIHVRRGDVTTQKDLYPFLDIDNYYRNACNYIKSKVNNITWIIFSDDIEWCKSQSFFKDELKACFVDEKLHGYVNLRMQKTPIFDWDAFDLWFMAWTKHHILYCSTFSWWAEFLSREVYGHNNVVVSPKKWFEDLLRKKGMTEDDLLQPYWHLQEIE